MGNYGEANGHIGEPEIEFIGKNAPEGGRISSKMGSVVRIRTRAALIRCFLSSKRFRMLKSTIAW